MKLNYQSHTNAFRITLITVSRVAQTLIEYQSSFTLTIASGTSLLIVTFFACVVALTTYYPTFIIIAINALTLSFIKRSKCIR